MATKTGVSPSSLSADLGLGDQLALQRQNETEEERKKRMLGLSSTQNALSPALLLGGLGGMSAGSY